MKKKSLFGLMALLLGLLLVFTLAACGGSDSSDPFIPGGNDGGSTHTNPGGGSTTPAEYVIFDLTTGTITDYIGPGGNVTIPSSINGKPVTAIGDNAFFDKNLTSVTIPNSVTSIGTNAFRSNKLTNVNIPNSVTSIGINTFRSNLLTIVIIPNSVTFIKGGAFYENRLIRITIGGNVTLETNTTCFDGYFDNFYRNNSRVAGTYTRPNTSSNDWTRDGDNNSPGNTDNTGDGSGLPTLTGTVSISGTAQVGQILTAITTNLNNKSRVLSYQWKRNGIIIGSDFWSYTVEAADVGSTITVTVTCAGNSGSLTSAPTAVVTAPGGGTTYTVTFDANGATSGIAPAAQTVTTGSSIIIPSGSGLSRAEHFFGDWNTNATGTGDSFHVGSSYIYNIASNFTLYAYWVPTTLSGTYSRYDYSSKITYSITFYSNGSCTYTQSHDKYSPWTQSGTYEVYQWGEYGVYVNIFVPESGTSLRIMSPNRLGSGRDPYIKVDYAGGTTPEW